MDGKEDPSIHPDDPGKYTRILIVPCTVPEIGCKFRLMYANGILHGTFCTKWRLQRDRETMIHGCNKDYPRE